MRPDPPLFHHYMYSFVHPKVGPGDLRGGVLSMGRRPGLHDKRSVAATLKLNQLQCQM